MVLVYYFHRFTVLSLFSSSFSLYLDLSCSSLIFFEVATLRVRCSKHDIKKKHEKETGIRWFSFVFSFLFFPVEWHIATMPLTLDEAKRVC